MIVISLLWSTLYQIYLIDDILWKLETKLESDGVNSVPNGLSGCRVAHTSQMNVTGLFFDQYTLMSLNVLASIYSHFDRLVQERCNSIANALELRLSCINPSICDVLIIQGQSNENIPKILGRGSSISSTS